MILSMTGYGKSSKTIGDKVINAEVRSLNSRQLDLSVKLPHIYKDKEFDIRKSISKQLIRGKVDVMVTIEHEADTKEITINSALIGKYYRELKNIEKENNMEGNTDYFSLIMKLPDVIEYPEIEVKDEEINTLCDCINEALEAFQEFRKQEGEALYKDIKSRINKIMQLSKEVDKLEPHRIEIIKTKLLSELDKLDSMQFDNNRFEQEIIYYLEKLDITEERIRTNNHCNYFLEVLDSDSSQGKQLGFIVQEIGRELNTLGSKANYSEIQRLVVCMKEELEKIREQIANIL